MVPSKSNFIVADSSFYICFLEDIKRPDALLLMLNKFEFAFGKTVNMEISKCEHFGSIKGNSHLNLIPDLNFSEVLKPFFGEYENAKGESEIIALAIILYGISRIDKLILDEDGPRAFVERNLPNLAHFMTGTVGFVGKCCCETYILEAEKTLQILSEIEHSPFRVSYNVLSTIRRSIYEKFGL